MTKRAAAYSVSEPRLCRSSSAALAALLAAAVVAPAHAQDQPPPTGTRLGAGQERRAVATDEYEARRRALRLAECMYFKRGAAVRGYLSGLSEQEQARHQRNLSDSVECSRVNLGDGLRLTGAMIMTSPDVMRGNYAEAVLAKITEDDKLQPVPAPTAGPPPSYVRDWFAITSRHPTIDEMAVCVAEQNPEGIRRLIATRPETDEEKAGVQAIAPSLGPCLPQGATLKANRQSLRAALAEALYHRAIAPAFTPGS